jgi:hypothetical protein
VLRLLVHLLFGSSDSLTQAFRRSDTLVHQRSDPVTLRREKLQPTQETHVPAELRLQQEPVRGRPGSALAVDVVTPHSVLLGVDCLAETNGF